MINVQCKCLRKLSQLTNHRVYQELVYQNEVLKTMLTALQAPILHLSPAPTWFLQDFSRSAFLALLEPETGILRKNCKPIFHTYTKFVCMF